jgi:hypothetical protein
MLDQYDKTDKILAWIVLKIKCFCKFNLTFFLLLPCLGAYLPSTAPKLYEIGLVYIQELMKHEIIDMLDFLIRKLPQPGRILEV